MNVIPDSAPACLSAPRTTLFADPEGNTEAAYIQFRTGKTVRVEQPNPDYPVFLYIGADGLPVGVKLTAPISGTIRSEIEHRLVVDGRGVGIEMKVTHSFSPRIPLTLVDSTLRQMDVASQSMVRLPA